ncbi:P-loop containing nucleoside triphosphate hydrolase protein [Lobosporangium transversale]|uniref:p-loop containing nucleoside triphosphate hydrolase protein n=1 Tax=Lobosporangium transversale TaxID=64571 RepID=A0A1Y2GU86_9FUNG|nr:P-loop containing nucleoside triphosphate hydrolase protein [Lobosporangium transversale]ORZ23800.1 P-loop containing nucleoside triphosphate hydrolase protein [Lobosporangium transversale]|eukprot:XP_021883614.1 P-loop containing nucleoside triphosphate hydrolase protein [Lobosporangium transversale]
MTYHGIAGGGSFINLIHDDYRPLMDELKETYRRKIKPLETTYNFEGFHSAPLSDSDIEAKPIVLLIGQYSTGKTTFIKHLTECDYPGSHIGVEPTTDRFVAVMNGVESRVIPGNAAAMTSDMPFRGLNKFGQAFLTRFQVSQCPAPLLENMTLIDTPGILAGNKQRIERGYDFTKIIEWFAERADLILLFFDSHKLDISDEFKASIHSLKGQEEKVRVILNKCDMVSQQQLMRVYGALMWSLGKVIHTPEVMRVYLGSFWIHRPPNVFEDCRGLLDAEQADLIRDLRELPRNAAIRKVNEIVKRARQAKVHAYIIGHLKKEMPAVFGKTSRQQELIRDLDKEFLKVQQSYGIPDGDFPNVEKLRQSLRAYKFESFSKLKEPILAAVEEALSVDLPKLMRRFPQGNPLLEQAQRNPFLIPEPNVNMGISGGSSSINGSEIPPSYWHFSSIDKASSTPVFKSLHPVEGRVNGSTTKPYLLSTGLSTEILAKVWALADWDANGYLDENEFAVVMHLIRAVEHGGEGVLPTTLPRTMIPYA